MTTEEEKSAVGIGEITGVLIDEAPAQSELYKAGFRAGELIIKLNDTKISGVKQLLDICKANKGKTVAIEVHDDSQERIYKLTLK